MSKFLGIRFVAFIICGLFVASPMQAHLRFDSLLIELDHVRKNTKAGKKIIWKNLKSNFEIRIFPEKAVILFIRVSQVNMRLLFAILQ